MVSRWTIYISDRDNLLDWAPLTRLLPAAKSHEFPEIIGTYGMVPRGLTWKEYAEQIAAAGSGWQTRSLVGAQG